jgi:hypothetical protein
VFAEDDDEGLLIDTRFPGLKIQIRRGSDECKKCAVFSKKNIEGRPRQLVAGLND